MTTCQQRPQIPGLKSGHLTQVWLKNISDNVSWNVLNLETSHVLDFLSFVSILKWLTSSWLLAVRYSCSQFHQRYTRTFFVRIFQQSQNVTRKMTFVRKICTYNVDEIDTWQLWLEQRLLQPRPFHWLWLLSQQHHWQSKAINKSFSIIQPEKPLNQWFETFIVSQHLYSLMNKWHT